MYEKELVFMRLAVISDTHGRAELISRVLLRESEAKEVFFLGDVVSDIEKIIPEFPDRIFRIVHGNCDYFSNYPLFDIVEYPFATVYFTHGHRYGVKYGTEGLLHSAKGAGANIALYGHTHIASVGYKDGVFLVNGGSLALPRDGKPSYAVIDITDKGILPAVKYL